MNDSSIRPDSGSWLAWLGEPSEAGAADPRGARHPVARLAEGQTRSALALRVIGESVHKRQISAEDGACTVIFDGVLHNRAELYERLSHVSRAASDAELVLQAYRRWREDLLPRVKGAFALIVWDGARELLWCARDPLGVYPLFYAEKGREVFLSTSLEALVRHPSLSCRVSRLALARHLSHDWLGLEETHFESVKGIPSGHAMRIERGERRVYRYWDPAPPDAPVRWISEDELERFDGLLEQAVDRCLRLGPTGVLLSGGLDSTTVATVAAGWSRRQGLPLPSAFSLDLADPTVNEVATQKRVAADLGLRHAFYSLDEIVGPQGTLASALELTRRWPWPLAHPGIAPFYELNRQGKRHGCLVMMSGNGGDEWLSFNPFYVADLLRTFDIAGLGRLLGVAQRCYPQARFVTTRNLLWLYGARPLLAAALRRAAPRALSAYRRRHHWRLAPEWLAPDPALRRELHESFERSAERSLQEPPGEMLYLRYHRRLLETGLEEDFEIGRQLGVRVLNPFWDADLVDFLYRIPPAMLNRGGRTKGLVRGTLARRFPGLGFERQRKLVLFTFYRDRVLDEGPAAWRQLGGVPSLSELGLVDAPQLSANVETMFSGRRLEQFSRIWDALNLETWLRPRL
jgi:asparagine synthase (glutamine-hydrolysing)